MNIPGLRNGGDEQDLPWKATNVPGVRWLPLHLDSGKTKTGQRRNGASVLIRMAPGASYGAHRHLGNEDVLVLNGGYRDELGEYTTGEHVHYEPGSCHTPVALGDVKLPESETNPVCILFAVTSAGIELLERPDA
jgi:anti-sigma factor ChrR (cupin superfamily)